MWSSTYWTNEFIASGGKAVFWDICNKKQEELQRGLRCVGFHLDWSKARTIVAELSLEDWKLNITLQKCGWKWRMLLSVWTSFYLCEGDRLLFQCYESMLNRMTRSVGKLAVLHIVVSITVLIAGFHWLDGSLKNVGSGEKDRDRSKAGFSLGWLWWLEAKWAFNNGWVMLTATEWWI